MLGDFAVKNASGKSDATRQSLAEGKLGWEPGKF